MHSSLHSWRSIFIKGRVGRSIDNKPSAHSPSDMRKGGGCSGKALPAASKQRRPAKIVEPSNACQDKKRSRFLGLPVPLRTVAAIDIGSHTLRMIIARLGASRALTPIRLERRITRLARNFNMEGRLSATSIEESIRALAEYAELARQYGVERMVCGATGVVRRAANGGAFMKDVEQTLGFPASILSEDAEALHSARGVLSVLSQERWPILTFDLGGGTTEFLLVDGRHEAAVWSTSVTLGAATLTEAWIHGDPPDGASIGRARAAAREALLPVFERVRSLLGSALAPGALQLVGTAGTVTTLAAMHLGMVHYEPYRVNGLVLKEDWLQGTLDDLASASLAERRGIPGLESGREDIIFAGALIVREIMLGLDQRELTVTDGGLLEGLLIDLVEKTYGWPQRIQTTLTWLFESCP
jgi:exopolyphosphatase / guanosine-5'-triphosphate,3'-diphosphate pyrophosphatase